MTLWTWFGLRSGTASTAWPERDGPDGQDGVLGMPHHDPGACRSGCDDCASVCPTDAITVAPVGGAPVGGAPEGEASDNGARVVIDYGRCVVCQLCTEHCTAGAMRPSHDWAFAVRDRAALRWAGAVADVLTPTAPGGDDRGQHSRRPFRRSLHVRHVDAGSCNGCESELQALNSPFYNLHRLGIFFTPSPRFADLLLVTGPVTVGMLAPLRATFEAMPEPRWVMAVGTCAVSGGVAAGGPECGHGLEGVLPVDVWLPGCPPNPAAIIHALLLFLDRARQRVQGGRLVE